MDQQTAPINVRQKQKAETRDRVLSAARKLFEAHGYTAVTVRMISDEAEVAVGSVFTAFESKDDLLVEIVCQDYEQLACEFARLLAEKAGAPLPERIVAALEPAIAYDITHKDKLREVMANGWTRSHAQEARTRAALAPLRRVLREAIIAAQADGQIAAVTDPGILTDMTLNLYTASIRPVVFDGWDAAQVAAAYLAQLKLVLR